MSYKSTAGKVVIATLFIIASLIAFAKIFIIPSNLFADISRTNQPNIKVA